MDCFLSPLNALDTPTGCSVKSSVKPTDRSMSEKVMKKLKEDGISALDVTMTGMNIGETKTGIFG